MRRLVLLVLIVILAGLAGLRLTRPHRDGPELLAGLTPDVANGAQVFTAAGCAPCHMAKGAVGDERLVLKGGQTLASPFGTFTMPNISQDKQAGIGAWAPIDLWNALHNGTTPDGRHLYPAFPYTSYIRLSPQQVVDLAAYLKTLPADPTPSRPHHLHFPFNIRALIGAWKALYLKPGWVMQGDLSAEEQRGREIVEAEAHCGECHTPRGLLGATKRGAAWLTGAPNPEGGHFPDLTPPKMAWSADDLMQYFTTGFTPNFDMVGGQMALVVDDLNQLPESDLKAVIAYLKRLPLGD